ncbi:MAG: Crp/Fnr family transcriptional regulator [Deltaproteobacteria bacterium]|nr:Crp/Fnr family transcriptional regulator [Deltaproteobacteria bacterium]
MHDEKRVLWYLKKVPIFSDLGAEALTRLAEKVELREIQRRHVIYLPGDPGSSVFILNGGRVKVSKVTRDGKELTLLYCVPGDVFGEQCMIDGAPRQEMAEAVENALITVMDRGDFERLVAQHAQLGLKLVRILAMRRLELEAKIENLIFKDVNSKLADLLLRLCDEHGVEDMRGTLVALKITHQEMANLIGSTRETVSLTLAQFKRKGLIHTDGRKVIVSDREALRALA